jgi:hypothetical protein
MTPTVPKFPRPALPPVVVLYNGRTIDAERVLARQRKFARSKRIFVGESLPDVVLLGSLSHSMAAGLPYPQVWPEPVRRYDELTGLQW